MTVISLQAAREDRTPHLSGMVRCLACRVKWAAVAPAGTVWMECPACSLERGRFIESARKAGAHWYCHCGCDLFHVTPNGYYCPNCGSGGNHEFPAA